MGNKMSKKLFLVTVSWENLADDSEYEVEADTTDEALERFWRDSDIRVIKDQIASVHTEETPWTPEKDDVTRI